MKTELTRDLELLRDLTDEELTKVRAIAATRTYPPSGALLRQGEAAQEILIILEGEVRVTAILAAGDEVTGEDEEMLVRLGPGEVLGELSFVTEAPPNLSVIANELTTVAAIPHDKLRELFDADGALCRKMLVAIMRMLVARVRDTGKELVLARYFMRR